MGKKIEGSIKLVVSTSSWQFSDVRRLNAKRSTYGASEDRQLEGGGVEEVAFAVFVGELRFHRPLESDSV